MGRSRARIGYVRQGDILECDAGFTCMDRGSQHVVHKADDGLYIECREGRHYLVGQVDGHFYSGLSKVEG
jgi:hypothetical protein